MARFRRGDDSNSATAERKDALGSAPGMPALLGIGCGKFLQSIFPGGLRHGFPDGFVLGRYAGLWGHPRSTTSERLDWRGVLQKWAAKF
jgi:hypothetical protein